MDRWEPMNNPLELTGRVLGLSRPDPGRVLIVGGRRDRRRLARCLGQGPWAGLPVVGFVDAGHPRYSGGSAAAGTWPSTRGPTRSRSWAASTGSTSSSIARGPPTSSWPSRDAPPSGSGRGWLTCATPTSPSTGSPRTPDSGAEPDRASRRRTGRRTRPVWPLAWERLAKRVFDVAAATARPDRSLAPVPGRLHHHPRHLGSAHLLLAGAGRAGGPDLPDAQVPEHEARRRGGDRPDLGLEPRLPLHADRRLAAAHQHRRIAPTGQRGSGRDEPGRPPPRAPGLRRAVPRRPSPTTTSATPWPGA